ncbi:synaptotagmin-10-like [Penaeus monodon]|uniref:synaptotagmin-10-like n=1 Tax=Penaeus monodon TaxID=6687 RepID=UPI0018A781C5|nr:synaptotagmin-10-like [Penaeus monodon]
MTSAIGLITSTESLLAQSTESSNTSFAQFFVDNIDTDPVEVSQRPFVEHGGSTPAMLGYLVLGLVAAALLVLVALYLTRTSTSSAFFRRDVETGLVSWGRGRGFEGQAAVMISHSLPDLSRSVSQEQLLPVDNKKVARQTTLPTVPQRHASFQRQLSQRLHLDSIQFSVCNLEKKDDLGLLKPELYRNELIRQASVESSGAGSDTEAVGRLRFTLKYDPAIEGLIVKVRRALLPLTGSSDPYIKVYLLPDRKKKFCTKVHRRNLNPEFNEVFVFSVTWAELRDRTLQFSVYDFDRFSRNDLIGQVVLKSVTEHCDPEQEMEYLMDILNTKGASVDL